ncbi:MAG: dihydropteroate synthase [Thermotogaceae bacterium]|jgi:dihydropteroate synthase|nr:dihydropteroate synthase [Thermotogaceae bacterium]MDN5336987.1 dihydropteroate synthase [Thermotogaceae bacterium]
MIIRMLDPSHLVDELEKSGVSRESFDIFLRKANCMIYKIHDLKPLVANVIKQEMLAAGGNAADAAVHRESITMKVDKTDVILIGNKNHYRKLFFKLDKMNYWGLPEIKNELEEAIENCEKKREIFLKNNETYSFDTMKIMGIINITDDSFYPGSRRKDLNDVLNTAEQMIKNGVDILDIGGESTRPGSEPVELEEELQRVVPVIKAIKENFDILVSVDTYKAKVAAKAIEVGADIINDISAMRFDKDMATVVRENNVPIVLMHIKGTPKDMQLNPYYDDVIKEIMEYFYERINYSVDKGIDPKKIIIDPGIGFGKRLEDNIEILRKIDSFKVFGRPLLIGASRKSMIGAILGNLPVEERLEGTLAISSWAFFKGVDIIRVHDVKENYRLVKVLRSIA